MSSDEALHPGHHSIRLKHRDYRAAGNYFVTICSHEKKCVFGRIVSGATSLSRLGEIVNESWTAIPSHLGHIKLHAFVVMPNHVHGLVEIVRQTGAQHAASLQNVASDDHRAPQVQAGSLAAMVRSFKSVVTKRARAELLCMEDIWQRNYFERVVRDGQEFADAWGYVLENPQRWGRDQENPRTPNVLTPGQAGAQHAAPLQTRGLR